MSFGEVLKSAADHMKDRLVSPLAGAFIICWLAWNWRVVLTMLSSEKLLRKIGIAERFLYEDAWWPLANALWIPLGLALLYILVYPEPARWVYSVSRWYQNRMIRVRLERDLQTPIPESEARMIRNENATLAQKIDELKTSLQVANAQLHESNRSLRDAVQQKDALQTQLNDAVSMIEVMRAREIERALEHPYVEAALRIVQADSKVTKESLAEAMKLDDETFSRLFMLLSRQKLIDLGVFGNSAPALAARGEKYLEGLDLKRSLGQLVQPTFDPPSLGNERNLVSV